MVFIGDVEGAVHSIFVSPANLVEFLCKTRTRCFGWPGFRLRCHFHVHASQQTPKPFYHKRQITRLSFIITTLDRLIKSVLLSSPLTIMRPTTDVSSIMSFLDLNDEPSQARPRATNPQLEISTMQVSYYYFLCTLIRSSELFALWCLLLVRNRHCCASGLRALLGSPHHVTFAPINAIALLMSCY